jgi:hypothetical protein
MMEQSWPLKDPAQVSVVLEALGELETLQEELAKLPVNADERAALLDSIQELRRQIRSLVT